VLPDGDIVAVGIGIFGGQVDIVVVRLNSNGSLDTAFDVDGVLILAPTILDDYAYSGTVLSDGDIIIAGVTATSASNNDLYMARINSDGTLDNSFDSDGSVIINVSANDSFVDLAVRSDGNIAIAGSAIADPTVVVVTPTGALYTAFNDDGVSRITGLPWAITVNALSIQADGKMVFAGRKTDGSVNSHLVGRLTANGNLDPTFNGDGLNIIEVGTPVYQGTLHEIVVQPDGKSAAIGSFFDPSSPSYTRTILFRLTSSGTLDTTLNSSTTPGYVASGLSGGDDEGYAIAVNSTGQLFTGLTSWTGSGRCVGISRYNTTLAPTTWTDESLSPALKNVAYSDTVASNLGAAATYTLQSGTLPTGVALAANGSLSGTPTATGVFPITIRATTGSGTLDLNTTLTINNTFTPVTPARVADTRNNTGGVGTTKIGNGADGGNPLTFRVLGTGNIPSTGVAAVSLNVTAVGTQVGSEGGYISVYPCANGQPDVSNLNFVNDQTVPNAVIVPVDTNGNICAYVYGKAHIIIDVNGWFASNSGFTTVTPARVADTRNNTGGVGTTKIGNGANGGNPLTFRVLGTGNIPSTGVAAVSLNVTAVGTQVGSEGGYISVYPCANGQPDVSNLNFVNDQTVPNAVIVPVDTNGNICAYVYGKAHIIIDVNGWFASNSGFTTVTPARVADTRNNTGGVGTTKIGNGANGGNPLTFRVLGTGNIPSTGVAAVSLNVTAVGTQVGSEGGYISVYPCANGQPDVSNLNFVNDQTVPNAVIVPVDTNGNICAYVYGKAHIIIDVNGWFASNSGFTTVTPARVADTRNNTGGVGTTKIGNGANGGEPMIFRVGLRGGIPSTGVAAVSLNVTAVGTQVGSEGGYISVYPCANGQPDVSNLNFVNDQTVPNAVIVPVDTNGNICAYVYGKAHIIIDVNGWFS
jgi:uncharacterized delta-60 repeat protein